MAVLPKFFIDSVVSIGIENDSSNISWIGTGFFVTRKVDSTQSKPFLVTNKHVLSGYNKVVIRMKQKDTGKLITLNANTSFNNKQLYFIHPNADIDIAVLPIDGNVIMNLSLDFNAFDIDEHSMTSSELISNDVDEGAIIHMLGFPMGLVNLDSITPICRMGCIARLDSKIISKTHNFLADIQNFPGNSGSPIVIRPELMSIQGTKNMKRAALIGVVHSYIPYQESLINSQTKRVVDIRSENSGIAYVHPVEYVKDIINIIFPKVPSNS